MKKLNALVVEDSASARALLVEILRSDPGFEDVRIAVSGEDALRVLADWTPDVVTMDINMTGIDGFETTSRIMQTKPLPIIVVSGHWNPAETQTVFKTMEAGALTALAKPPSPMHPDFDRRAAELVQSIKLLSKIKPIRKRVPKRQRERFELGPDSQPIYSMRPQFLAIGGSTGAPPVLKTILSGLPRSFPAPILVVQHISPGFLPGMARWLKDSTGHDVVIAKGGAFADRGTVYLAPDHHHMTVGPAARLHLHDGPHEYSMRPAVSVLFRSLATNQPGNAVGVLLTGMGEDGASDLKAMRDTGCTTIAQDEASSVVWGMPGRAVQLDATRNVLPPEGIIEKIARRFGVSATV